jgi:hypothetical protein
MRYFAPGALAVLLVLELVAPGQVGTPYPGQYPPGGRYPGGRGGIGGVGLPPIPRPAKKTKKTTTKEEPENLIDVTGVLRKIDEKTVVVQAQDTRIITMQRSEKTAFLKDAKPIRPEDLKPGDRVVAECKQDDQGFLYAVNVLFRKEGTAEERAAASEPIESLTPPPAASDQQDDRPVLRKKTATEESEEATVRPATTVRELPQHEEAAPVLRRRKPGERPAAPPAPAPVETAAAPVPEPVRETAVVVHKETAPADPVIEKAREMAASFTEGLPNYYCRQLIARFVNTSHKVNWQPLDVVSAEVIYENGRERYRNIAINGKPTKKSMHELPGSWSTGEFGTVLANLFSPGTAATFTFSKEDRAAGLSALVYEFFVEQERSHWTVHAASQSVQPAYSGGVWIDKKSHRVLRIEVEAKRVPYEFPYDKVELSLDYQYIRLGSEAQFLVPVHAETLLCQRGTNICSRNVIDFRNYHKYTSESSIIFTP